jgi:cell division protein FtsX
VSGAWLRELALGARLARSGGRGALARVGLTAVGVGIGVALLLVAASLPHILSARDERTAARSDLQVSHVPSRAGDTTLLVSSVDDHFRADSIRGRLLRAEGPRAPVPPGLDRLPRAGELFVSPALAELLRSGDGALLRERLPQRIAGTIGDAGLAGPGELAWYLGSDRLAPSRAGGTASRIDRFGDEAVFRDGLDPVLQTLAVVMLTALLLPVAVFVAAAARFGGEARDRRLAALRLLGADMRMTRRIAAGEALVAALFGLLLGALLFLLVRRLAGEVTLFDLSVFPSDVRPSAGLALAVVLGVPVAAVGVTLVAMRGVVIDPLGAVRRAQPRRRRVWWRLALPALGALLLLPLVGGGGTSDGDELQLAAGVVLVLFGVAALLPWVVEAAVHRLGGGGVSWQLATRRLQLDSGASARVVSGIAVAVAGAIALQTTFSAVERDYVRGSGDGGRVVDVWVTPGEGTRAQGAAQLASGLRAADGVRVVEAVEQLQAAHGNTTDVVRVADCATLRRTAGVGRCADGDAFLLDGASSLRAGARVRLGSEGGEVAWTIPRAARTIPDRGSDAFDDGAVVSIPDPVLATPGALAGVTVPDRRLLASVTVDEDDPDAIEHLRNAAARIEPTAAVYPMGGRSYDRQYASLRRGLFAGAVAVLMLIGASMLVGALEQLRERRRPLAVLAAFGAPAGALARSLLWQTAIPVALGLGLAVVAGAGLGAALLRMVGEPVGLDLGSIAGLAGTGAAVVLLVTVATLPALRRTVRPEGLRAE